MHKNNKNTECCGVKCICDELQKLGYGEQLNWVAIVLFVRNIVTELSILNDSQKKEAQEYLLESLATRDPSSKHFSKIIHGIEKIINQNEKIASLQSELTSYKQYSKALSETISNFAAGSLSAEKDKVSLVTKFSTAALEGLNTVESCDAVILKLRSMVSNMLEHYRDEAQKWEHKARQLEQVVNVDPMLTTVHNRRALDTHLRASIAQARSNGSPLSLIMIDIDNFKKDINDIHGHVVGDDILRTLAKILTMHATEYKLFAARYGGDEFVLVSNFSGEKAMLHANAIRYAVQSYEFRSRVGDKLSDEVIRFTVSVGLAEYKVGWTVEQLLKAADLAMYSVKKGGKNNVSRFSGADDPMERRSLTPSARPARPGRSSAEANNSAQTQAP